MDALGALRLQIEWGADEALDELPVVRTRSATGMGETLSARTGAAPVPPPQPPGSLPTGPASTGSSSGVPIARARVPHVGPATTANGGIDPATANDLDALRQMIRDFDGCPLRDTATSTVLPEGDAAAGILILGEVPDADEDRAGRAFAGRPGELLDRMMRSIGLRRDGVLLAPLIPWRPPGGRPPSARELASCQPFLDRLLILARPRFLLLMGGRPARAVLGGLPRPGAGWQQLPMGDAVSDGCRALAMRHPAMLLSHPPARKEAWTDLLRLHSALHSITDA